MTGRAIHPVAVTVYQTHFIADRIGFFIGDMSKAVTSWIVVVFLVFFNTFEGARSIDEGFVNVARLLGASE